jgi:predicted esterase
MLEERARRVRRALWWTCVLCAITWGAPATASESTPPTRARSTSPEWLRADASPDVLVYPPRSGAARAPVAVMLHGMCGAPENACPAFAEGVARDRWLVCPRGNVRCDGGGATWSLAASTSLVNDAVSRVAGAHPGEVDEAHGMLIGFSWGALAAVDVAERSDRAPRWESMVLIAADVRPDAARLKRAGVRSVYMGAGRGDMMRDRMVEASRRLARSGVPSVFEITGDVGHAFPPKPEMDAWVAGALRAVRADRDEAAM